MFGMRQQVKAEFVAAGPALETIGFQGDARPEVAAQAVGPIGFILGEPQGGVERCELTVGHRGTRLEAEVFVLLLLRAFDQLINKGGRERSFRLREGC